jgi:hypothetical protein
MPSVSGVPQAEARDIFGHRFHECSDTMGGQGGRLGIQRGYLESLPQQDEFDIDLLKGLPIWVK